MNKILPNSNHMCEFIHAKTIKKADNQMNKKHESNSQHVFINSQNVAINRDCVTLGPRAVVSLHSERVKHASVNHRFPPSYPNVAPVACMDFNVIRTRDKSIPSFVHFTYVPSRFKRGTSFEFQVGT